MLKQTYVASRINSLSNPLSQIMKHPVVASDGHTYEREAITQWLTQHITSPMTGHVMPNTDLTPNRILKSMIRDLVARKRDRVREGR